MEFKKLEEIILNILNNDVYSRYSDHFLYLKVIYRINPILKDLDFKEVFCNYEYYKLPGFKAVERARRKLTEKGLYTPPTDIKKGRDIMMNKYVEYAMSGRNDIYEI